MQSDGFVLESRRFMILTFDSSAGVSHRQHFTGCCTFFLIVPCQVYFPELLGNPAFSTWQIGPQRTYERVDVSLMAGACYHAILLIIARFLGPLDQDAASLTAVRSFSKACREDISASYH